MTSINIPAPKARFYTTIAQAKAALAPDMPGAGVRFQAGRGYYIGLKPVAAKKPTVSTPMPLTDEQAAHQQVSAAFDPVLASIKSAFANRSSNLQNAINSYTHELGDLLGQYGPAAGRAYGTAAAGDSAINAALAATREGQGAQAQTELAQQLAKISADPATAARIQGGQSADLRGEAFANATRGASNLAMLLGEGANAADYGAKLPGIGGQSGLRATERLQGQLSGQLNDAVTQLESKVPDAYQTALAGIQGNKLKQAQIDFENNLAAKKFGLDTAKAKASVAQGNARIAISQQNADTAAKRAAQSALNSDRTYAVNLKRIGISQKNAQIRALAQEAKLKNGGFTPLQVQKFKGTALTLADQAFHGFTDAKGAAHPALSYQQAVLEGQKEGIPLSILLPALQRIGYVSPALAAKQAKVAASLFPSPFDALVSGGK